ncbi:MAG: AAA family ATPase [Desulfobacterales bacterium]|nr:AAA family ATPase [Desulfobacterales bacterium]
MDYFQILNLNREPFPNSPDPDLFFKTRQHQSCLQKLELSFRLRRGLNVVVGDVGTGKTTLCRQLIRQFAGDKDVETYLVLDPSFSDALEFLKTITQMFEGVRPEETLNAWQLKEIIKTFLFRKGVDEKKTVILIVDEGQKIPVFCLEILREFLNYETNEFKLLQIVIFAQKEFQQTLKERANLADRINLYHVLEPLNFQDTRAMIQFRLNKSSRTGNTLSVFSYPALWRIYSATKGHPRKIINLCHQSVLAMIIQNRSRVGWSLVRSCMQRTFSKEANKLNRVWIIVAAAGLIIILITARDPLSFRLPTSWNRPAARPADPQVGPLFPSEAFRAAKIQAPYAPQGIKVHPSRFVSRLSDNKKTPANSITPPATRAGPGGVTVPGTAGHDRPYPAVLGKVAVRPGETLSHMIKNVYNSFKPEYLISVNHINPHIQNPDMLEAGAEVTFPAIPVAVNPPHARRWWIRVSEKERLDSAVEVLRAHAGHVPPLALVSYWHPGQAFKFAVVVSENYPDPGSASTRLARLSALFSKEGKIVSLWDKEAVFFTDPFVLNWERKP